MILPHNILGESDDIREELHMSIKGGGGGVAIKEFIRRLGTCQSKHSANDQVEMSCFPPADFGFSFGFHRTLRRKILGFFGNSNRCTSRLSQ